MEKRLLYLMASVVTLFSLTGCDNIKSTTSKGYEKCKQNQYDYLEFVGGKKKLMLSSIAANMSISKLVEQNLLDH